MVVSVDIGEGKDNITTNRSVDNKFVILTFGNAPSSQYTYAKPILDK